MIGDLFGINVDGDDVEAALLAHLKRWMPSYVPDIVREKDPDGERWPGGVGPMVPGGPPSVLPVHEFTVKHAADEKWPEDQLPMLLAHCPGFAAPPSYEGDGTVSASFLVNLSAIASGVDIEDTKKLARVYGSAANKIITQKPDLGGFAENTQWVDLKNFPISKGVEGERNLMAVANVYIITVAKVLDHQEGPDAPLEEPNESPGERPVAKKTSEDVRPGKAAVDLLRKGGHFDEDTP